ncbi:MAG: hypothetical protein ACW981_03525 [Candidatus Hodarchaeales archaeon]|jgi:hypothetical protein
MKSICLRDVNSNNLSVDKLFSIVENQKPDIIMCFGGLFVKDIEQNSKDDQKKHFDSKLEKKSKMKQRMSLSQTTLILEQLAIFHIPIIIIPNEHDLKQKSAIKRAKNTENLLYRWLFESQFTTIEGWSFIGFSNESISPNIIGHNFFEANVIWCFTTNPHNQINGLKGNENFKSLPDFLIYPDKFGPANLSSTVCIQLPSLDSKKLVIVDFDNKSYEQINL